MEHKRLFQALYLLFLINMFLRIVVYTRASWKGRRFWTFSAAVALTGLFLVFTGFFVSMVSKKAIRPLVGRDDVIRTAWDPSAYFVEKISPRLQSRFLDMDEGAGWFAYEPEMVVKTGRARVRVGAFPPSRFGRTWMHILQCGLGPGMRLVRNGITVREGHAALRLLPPGGTDFLEFDGLPYRFMMKLLPKSILRKGDVEAGVYDLENPLYEVRIFRGDETVLRARSDEHIEFDGFEVEMLSTEYWALLDVVRDDGILMVAVGLLLFSAGMGLILLWSASVGVKGLAGSRGRSQAR